MIVTQIGLYCYLVTTLLASGANFPSEVPPLPEEWASECQVFEDGSYVCEYWNDALEPFECLADNEEGIDIVVTLPDGLRCNLDWYNTGAS